MAGVKRGRHTQAPTVSQENLLNCYHDWAAQGLEEAFLWGYFRCVLFKWTYAVDSPLLALRP